MHSKGLNKARHFLEFHEPWLFLALQEHILKILPCMVCYYIHSCQYFISCKYSHHKPNISKMSWSSHGVQSGPTFEGPLLHSIQGMAILNSDQLVYITTFSNSPSLLFMYKVKHNMLYISDIPSIMCPMSTWSSYTCPPLSLFSINHSFLHIHMCILLWKI